LRPYYQEDGVTIYHGDCREVSVDTWIAAGVDLVLTDPPYGINLKTERTLSKCNKWNSQQSFGRIMGDDSGLFDPRPLLGLDKKKIILWGANYYADLLPPSGGWLIWDKRRGGTMSPGFIASDVELAWSNLFGTARIFSHLWNGLCRDSEVAEHYHPTQKPIALMAWCIKLAGLEPGALVFDPFMGSGTALVAATNMGCRTIGIEIEERYCEIAVERLRQRVLDF
jgi:DNA modification methylase